MAEPITHLEQTIAGQVEPVTHLEQVIAEYSGGDINEQLEAGTNIVIEPTADGKAKISASGEVSSEDTYAREEIQGILDGTTLDSFGDVETALSGKVDTESGKGLSENDFTNALKTKLDGIASGAEVNVQADWEQTDNTADDYIKGKPTLANVATSGSYNDLSDKPNIPTVPTAYTSTPAMDGVGSAGSSTSWAKGDHVHPSDTSKVDKVQGKGLSENDFTDTLKTKLDGIAAGAEVNVQSDWEQTDNTADDYIKGKPTIPTVNDSTITIQKNGTTVKSFTTNQASGDTINITVPTTAADVSAIPTSAKGTASGVAELDSNGKVPSSQLPSYVDDVIEGYYYNGKFYEESAHTTEITGETGKIYIDLSGTNKTYRWSGSGYTEISESLALGETSSTAYRGDRGKTAYDHATETRLTTATASGLYKVASTAEGHIASLTSVQKSDITGLGIPAQDTTYNFEGAYNASTNKAATMDDIKDGKLKGYSVDTAKSTIGATTKVVDAIEQLDYRTATNESNISTVADSGGVKNIFVTTETTSTIEGCTFTNNGDGTWTTTSEGAIANRAQKSLTFTVPNTLESGTYVISGCAAGGGSDAGANYDLYVWDNTTNTRVSNNDYGEGRTFEWTPDSTHSYSITIDIRAGKNPNGLVFKPMICTKAQWDISHTFQPYAMSNAAITAWILSHT